jgi:hypothetical protein
MTHPLENDFNASDQHHIVLLQFPVEGPGISDETVQCSPELLAVVLDSRVNQFVKNDVIEHLLRQDKELHVETDVVFF